MYTIERELRKWTSKRMSLRLDRDTTYTHKYEIQIQIRFLLWVSRVSRMSHAPQISNVFYLSLCAWVCASVSLSFSLSSLFRFKVWVVDALRFTTTHSLIYSYYAYPSFQFVTLAQLAIILLYTACTPIPAFLHTFPKSPITHKVSVPSTRFFRTLWRLLLLLSRFPRLKITTITYAKVV